jgi:hypothetical protein
MPVLLNSIHVSFTSQHWSCPYIAVSPQYVGLMPARPIQIAGMVNEEIFVH